MATRRKWLCLDCQVDTGKLHEHYFVKNEVWFLVVDSNKGMLCVGCLEARLGRPLLSSDFTDAYINNPKFAPMSARLLARINGHALRSQAG